MDYAICYVHAFAHTVMWLTLIMTLQLQNLQPTKNPTIQSIIGFVCDPVWIRTKDLLLRRQLLYPAELRGQYFNKTSNVLLVEKGKKKGMISHPLSVGVARFELTTSCSQSRRDTGLRYTPRKISLFSLICQSFLFRCAKIRTFSYYASFFCGGGEIRTRGTVTRTSV